MYYLKYLVRANTKKIVIYYAYILAYFRITGILLPQIIKLYIEVSMNKKINIIMMVSSLLALLSSSLAFADYGLNMPQGVSSLSQEIYSLHMLIFWICVIIGIGVFGVMFYSIINHRKSKGAVAANFHESTKIELVWTIIPILILIAMAVPATKTLIKLEDTSKSDINIKVTGWQWKWQYEYPDEGISFFSNLSASSRDNIKNPKGVEHYLLDTDTRLVVPINKKIRFLIGSQDVIHSWWVPEIGVKQDAIPGFINDAWASIDKPGVYRGQCAELCGKDHGFMPIVLEAKTQADYDKWLADQKQKQLAASASTGKVWSKDALMTEGKKVYSASCAACHGVTGAGIPGAFPAIKGSPISLNDVTKHIDIVLHGKAGTAMQAFKAQLTDTQAAAVITYERNAFGNNTGDLVQPSTIKSAR